MQELSFGFHSPSLRAFTLRHCEKSEAIQCFKRLHINVSAIYGLDCFVSSFLAMTKQGLFAVKSRLCIFRLFAMRMGANSANMGLCCPLNAENMV
jgi:hypothetical protein